MLGEPGLLSPVESIPLTITVDHFGRTLLQDARASADGKTWRDLPKGVPAGKVVATPDGTLICIDRQRFNALRSTDDGQSWSKVYSFKPETEDVHGA